MEYKGMQLDDDVGSLIRYMPQVDAYREQLTLLQAVWDNLSLLGQLSGVGREMGNTREAFFSLSQSLINQLAREDYQRVQDSMKMKASVAVDMMLRNLFERTADIGFLATDDAIRHFMQQAPQWMSRYGATVRQQRDLHLQQMTQRLQEYVAKYSVYNNVILLTPQGDVIFQLHDTGVQQVNDPLIQEALLTQEAYIEVFRQTDLLPQVAQPHIYAYRVTDEHGEALGVLCLCFDFQDECQRIFAELDENDWAITLLTDAQGRVIASQDVIQVPLGTPMRDAGRGDVSVQRFAGRYYLSVSRAGKGYQGYLGQGWMGHVMIPLENAFEQQVAFSLALPTLDGLDIFSPDLMTIPAQADTIQAKLNRSVWNGRVHQARMSGDSVFGRALLGEVSQTGLKTKGVFSRAIENLYQTIIGASLANNRFLASLAVNIMDRNLYERANDCRWWALTDVFRQKLAGGAVDAKSQQEIADVLSYINGLYTVYTGLVVYDATGQVIAVSQPDLQRWVGTTLSEAWVVDSLALTDSQSYTVSSFAPTALYGGQSTYIYAAAIRHPDEDRVVGGIGIIFDSLPQFAAMLADSAPDGHGHESFAIYYDQHQHIVATTHPSLQVGDCLPADMTEAQENGAAIVSCSLGRYAVGVARSTGYREYKGHDDRYQQVIYAAMFKRIGDLLVDDVSDKKPLEANWVWQNTDGCVEIATVTIGAHVFGLSVASVLEAVDVEMMPRVAVGSSLFSGYITYRDRAVPVLDVSSYLGVTLADTNQAVIIEDQMQRFAILVDDIGSIVMIPQAAIVPIAHVGQQLVDSLVTMPAKEDESLMLLSASRIQQMVAGRQSAAAAIQPLLTIGN
jgi:chemotaxis signal transduction protein